MEHTPDDHDPHRDPREHPEAAKAFFAALAFGAIALILTMIWELVSRCWE